MLTEACQHSSVALTIGNSAANGTDWFTTCKDCGAILRTDPLATRLRAIASAVERGYKTQDATPLVFAANDLRRLAEQAEASNPHDVLAWALDYVQGTMSPAWRDVQGRGPWGLERALLEALAATQGPREEPMTDEPTCLTHCLHDIGDGIWTWCCWCPEQRAHPQPQREDAYLNRTHTMPGPRWAAIQAAKPAPDPQAPAGVA